MRFWVLESVRLQEKAFSRCQWWIHSSCWPGNNIPPNERYLSTTFACSIAWTIEGYEGDMGWYTCEDLENCPVFKTRYPPYSSMSKVLPPPWTWVSKWTRLNQSIKRKHNPRMTITCYQVLPLGRILFSVSTH